MSENEKKIIEVIGKALPNMTEFQKGHLLGTAEAMAAMHKDEDGEKKTEKAVI